MIVMERLRMRTRCLVWGGGICGVGVSQPGPVRRPHICPTYGLGLTTQQTHTTTPTQRQTNNKDTIDYRKS